MKIDKRLHLVIPIYDGVEKYVEGGEEKERDRVAAYVHASPISRETFRRYFLVIAKTFSRITGEGFNAVTGPRVAYMLLEDTAKEMGTWEGPEGVSMGLVAEFVRLANVLVMEGGRWVVYPLQDAVARKLISEDDADEVMNSLTFFTVGSSMYPKKDEEAVLRFATRVWGGRIESSSFTEFQRSLQTSTATDSSGAKRAAA